MKRPTHKLFKEEALSRQNVKAEYDRLEDTYNVAIELIRARKMRGKTQKEVACAMHTSSSVISNLESGLRHSPSIETLQRYADALDCKLLIKLQPKDRPKSNN